MPLSDPVLEVSGLTACYGSMTALKGIDFYAHEDEIVGILCIGDFSTEDAFTFFVTQDVLHTPWCP